MCSRCVAEREVALQLRYVGSKEMVSRNPLSREGSREDCHYSKCGGGRGACSSEKEVVENQAMGSGDENPREKWYNLENSSTKRRSMFHLERELDASLQFEEGGG